ncbi:MAG: CapA family protein [Acidobacteriota bacterium]|nr:CapA family protein [Acidobacteriota bacterium]MDE3169686.1 CapA family protein [Acidobacteriota bacterium]
MRIFRLAILFAIACAAAGALRAQSAPMTITLAGQSMIRSDLRKTDPAEMTAIQKLLQGDVRFTNFECTVAEPGQTSHEGLGFLTPPAALDALTAMGFNLLSLAGNHAYDLRTTGTLNTLREADRRKIVHAGIGKNLAEAAAPGYLRTQKGTVALIASASGLITPEARAGANHPGVNELRVEAGGQLNESTEDMPGAGANAPNAEDAQRILQSIREARRHADLVIVYEHNHVFSNHSFINMFTEGLPERLAPNPWLVKWTHEEIDAGADIVVMHGAPLLHGIEIYKGKPIFYDLGNFIYNVPPAATFIDEPMAWESVMAYVEFHGGKLRSVSLRPVALNNIGKGQPDVHSEFTNNEYMDTRGLPSPANRERAGYILRRVADESKPFGTKFEIRGETSEIQLNGAK